MKIKKEQKISHFVRKTKETNMGIFTEYMISIRLENYISHAGLMLD